MRYRLTDQARRKEHFSSLSGVVAHAVLVLGAFAFANGYLSPGDRLIGNILAGLMVPAGYLPWRKYLLYLRYCDKDAYIEVDDNTLWLSNGRMEKVAFPLHQVQSFVHKLRPVEVIELRTTVGDELDLQDYERMDELVKDLKRTHAGSKYELQM